jgi:chromosome segregation ATPase
VRALQDAIARTPPEAQTVHEYQRAKVAIEFVSGRFAKLPTDQITALVGEARRDLQTVNEVPVVYREFKEWAADARRWQEAAGAAKTEVAAAERQKQELVAECRPLADRVTLAQQVDEKEHARARAERRAQESEIREGTATDGIRQRDQQLSGLEAHIRRLNGELNSANIRAAGATWDRDRLQSELLKMKESSREVVKRFSETDAELKRLQKEYRQLREDHSTAVEAVLNKAGLPPTLDGYWEYWHMISRAENIFLERETKRMLEELKQPRQPSEIRASSTA